VDLPNQSVIEVLRYLLPGLVATQIYFSLTATVRPTPFDRTIQSLIFTIMVEALVVVVRACLLLIGRLSQPIGEWNADVTLVWSLTLAVAAGVGIAWASNSDALHRVARKLGMSFETSYPSEWFGAFAQTDAYVVLHLVSERRLYGWPSEWPADSRSGHFVIVQAEWLTESEPISLSGVEKVIVRAEEVTMVEMMKPLTVSEATAR
jgi:hypothetical protein